MKELKNQIIKYIAGKEKLEEETVTNILKTYSNLSIEHMYSENIKNIPIVLKHPVIDSIIGKTRKGIRIHIYGRPSASKTSLAASMATWYAYLDKSVLWIDTSYYFPDLYILNNSHKYNTDNIHITRKCPTIEDFEIISTCFDMIIIDDTFTLDDNIRENIGIVGRICSENECDLLMISQTRIDIFNYTNDIVPDIRATDCDLLLYVTKAERVQSTSAWRYAIKVIHYRGRELRNSVSYIVNHIGLDLPLFITKIALEKSIMLLKGPRIFYKGKSIAYVNKIHELGFDFVKEMLYILEGEKDESIKC